MRSRAWLFVCLLHAVASMLLWWAQEPAVQSLVWRSGEALQRPWTLWTTAWVHGNTPQLIANQMALGALVALAWLVRPDGWSTLAWCLAWPLACLPLGLWPQIGYVVGLAGVLHAAVGVLGAHLWLRHLPLYGARRWGAFLLAGLGAKLLLERGWSNPVVWDGAAEMSVVQAAMLCGALAGLVLGLLSAGAARALRPRQAPTG